MEFIESELLGDVTLWLSKSGELYREDELKALSKTITADQAVELYTYLRDNGERWESEWRESFISLFPQSESKLPEIAEADRWQTEVFEVIAAGELQGVKDFIQETGILENIKFDPADTYQEGQSMGFTDKVDYIPFDFFPVQVENEDGDYPVSYAREKGLTEIADYLQSVIDELSQRYRNAYEAGRKSKG
ncbi:hypothetical protein JIN82_00335 [Persicirhabdus sediminis]|uniref:Uncharacterized protein n=2 Tax=Persicirhabdus sediminis TaxID=454144 RepID=A0A8J7MBY8_9BACT|nr:hypothetical protein [Persicirhabdus sediminis]